MNRARICQITVPNTTRSTMGTKAGDRRFVALPRGVDDSVLDGQEKRSDLQPQPADHAQSDSFEPGPSGGCNTNRVVEHPRMPRHQPHQSNHKCGDGGKQPQHLRRSPAVGLACQIEVGGNARRQRMRPHHGVCGDGPQRQQGSQSGVLQENAQELRSGPIMVTIHCQGLGLR